MSDSVIAAIVGAIVSVVLGGVWTVLLTMAKRSLNNTISQKTATLYRKVGTVETKSDESYEKIKAMGSNLVSIGKEVSGLKSDVEVAITRSVATDKEIYSLVERIEKRMTRLEDRVDDFGRIIYKS